MTRATNLERLRAEGGLTVVELMVVLVFIAIGILALTGVQTRSFTDVYATGRHTRALDLAATRVERVRAAGYSLAASDSGITDGFNWMCVVDSADVALKRVTATVSWDEGQAPRSVQLVSLISSR